MSHVLDANSENTAKSLATALTGREFVKVFILPATLIFIVPILSYAFFWHSEATYDNRIRAAILDAIRADQSLTDEQRIKAIDLVSELRISRQLSDPSFAQTVKPNVRFHYAIFRWMLWLSIASVATGIAIFLLVSLCAYWSLRSQLAQYWCLIVCWHVLRIYGAAQTIVLATLAVALSYWITALWFEVYVEKLILFVAIIALGGCVAVIYGIFCRVPQDFTVDGKIVERSDADELWQEMNAICAKVGTNPPDQIIAGIDDNFFATECPITVDGKIYTGKTLFISLPLLKQLTTAEADTILAHEMAHFSVGDTFYTQRISPLIRRYAIYLNSLASNPMTMPVFLFMRGCRAMFELSLGRISRQREFRADRIAATVTSPRDLGTALMRTTAYSQFRSSIETELFDQQRTLELVDIPGRIERGFTAFAAKFASNPHFKQSEIPHPFDTHPPLIQRLAAAGAHFAEDELQSILLVTGSGTWYERIPSPDQVVQQLWSAYQQQFQARHQRSLPFRLLPERDEELAIVEVAFPTLSFHGVKGLLTIDFEKVHYQTWADPLYFREIARYEFVGEKVLEIYFERRGLRNRYVDFGHFDGRQREEFLVAFQKYRTRQSIAAKYSQTLNAKNDTTSSD